MLQTCKMSYIARFHVGRYIETCNKRTVNFLLHIKKKQKQAKTSVCFCFSDYNIRIQLFVFLPTLNLNFIKRNLAECFNKCLC